MIFENIDLAQIVLYAFWFFFFGLVLYMRREDKRVGYPLERERGDGARRGPVRGFPAPPPLKAERTVNLGLQERRAPDAPMPERQDLALRPTADFPGAPMTPTGDPLADGVGPAAWSIRSDRPEPTLDGSPKIVPLRLAADEIQLDPADPTLVGLPIYGADNRLAGVVREVWVERSEPQVRYLETELEGSDRRVLVPFEFCRLRRREGALTVKALHAHHFAGIPKVASDTQISFTEEDQIRGYFAGGYLYAEPSRLGPWL
jgi:photosynthetic reaction center H subunit